MIKKDGRELARTNELRLLKAIFKHGWMRTRDLAALGWTKAGVRKNPSFTPEPIIVANSAIRMAQRTIARLRRDRMVIHMQAPDGCLIYGLSEAGARRLVGLGIPAKTGKDQVRRVSLSHYHHRRLANELAVIAALQGYRVVSETEIAAGLWFGGKNGILGKRPDVVVRDGKEVWLVEVERSRRNKKDYIKLLRWLIQLWTVNHQNSETVDLTGGYKLKQVVFVCGNAFIDRLITDLRKLGWTEAQIINRIYAKRLLYVSEGKFIIKDTQHTDGSVDV